MAQSDDVTVFQAPVNSRIGAIVGIVVLLLLVTKVVFSAGWYATLGVVLVGGIIFNLWWIILRPRLIAGRDGIDVVSTWRPVRIAWKDVQRCEVGPKGTLIVSRGGQETTSKFPSGDRSTSSTDTPTEADRAAVFLAACAAWGRRPSTEPMPVYEPPAKPSK